MQCNCQTEIEQQLLERFKSEHPESANHTCGLHGYVLVLAGNSLESLPKVTAVFRHTVTAKSGSVREKKIEHSMVGHYCIFCGKPAKPQQTEV